MECIHKPGQGFSFLVFVERTDVLVKNTLREATESQAVLAGGVQTAETRLGAWPPGVVVLSAASCELGLVNAEACGQVSRASAALTPLLSQ